MKKNSKSLTSSLVFLSILCGLFLFFSGIVSAGSTSGEWQSARSGDPDPPALSPGPEDCDCNDGWPWWAWFLLGNGCWMTIRYIIKHMKEDEKVE